MTILIINIVVTSILVFMLWRKKPDERHTHIHIIFDQHGKLSKVIEASRPLFTDDNTPIENTNA